LDRGVVNTVILRRITVVPVVIVHAGVRTTDGGSVRPSAFVNILASVATLVIFALLAVTAVANASRALVNILLAIGTGPAATANAFIVVNFINTGALVAARVGGALVNFVAGKPTVRVGASVTGIAVS
jgi:hypothetical protein